MHRNTLLDFVLWTGHPSSTVLSIGRQCKSSLFALSLACLLWLLRRSSVLACPQDIPVSMKMIWDLWAVRKLDSQAAKDVIIESRCMGSERFYKMIDFHVQEESARHVARVVKAMRPRLEATMSLYHHDPGIDQFMGQFAGDSWETKLRMKPLLLRGPSESGKSKKGVSLFGSSNTLTVGCQGMQPALPSIREFNRATHLAILWDEIEESQVLGNKLIFQSGLDPVVLQQSACNVFAYSKWLFRIPMILCSNVFSFEGLPSKPLSPEDQQWLRQNIIEVKVPVGGTWYVKETDAGVL